jgi:hypothetical protein
MGTIDTCFASLLPALAAAHQVIAVELQGRGHAGDIAGLPASQLAVLPGTSHQGVLARVGWLQSMILEFLGDTAVTP